MLFVLCLQSGVSSHPTNSWLCIPSQVINLVSMLGYLVIKIRRLWSPSQYNTVTTVVG